QMAQSDAMARDDVLRAERDKNRTLAALLASADSLTGVNLHGADLRHAALRGRNLDHANLSCADMRCVDLTGTSMRFALLIDVKLDEATLTGADFFGAILVGCSLRNVKAPGKSIFTEHAIAHDPQSAELALARYTSFEGARILQCDFSGSTLRRASFIAAE